MQAEEKNRRYVLMVAAMAAFLTPFIGSSVNLAVPAIGREFKLEAVMLNWVVTAFLLTSAAFLLPFGRAADLYGRKKVFLAGLVVFSLSSLCSALAPSGKVLLLFRALHGIGGSMIFSTGMAILTSVFPPQERGKALGINVAAVYTGLSLGPVLGGFLTHYLGWRSLFLLAFVLGAAAALLTATRVKQEWVGAAGEEYDLPGAVFYTLSMALLMYGFSSLKTDVYGWWFFTVGMVLLALFVWQELRHRHPLLNLVLFKNPVFAFSNLAALIHYSATFGAGFLLSLYLQVVKGIDAQVAGFILLAQPVLMALLSPLAGRLSDRLEPRLLASSGMFLSAASLFLFSTVGADTPLLLLVGGLAVAGVGFAFFSSPNTNAVMSAVERRYYGVASATVSTMRLVGQAFSMAMITLFFGLYLRGLALTPTVAPLLLKSMKLSFGVFAFLCLLGVAASMARGRVRETAN